ncbi:RusA family crossover junction endodeoxyribonuclease [Methylibium sp.]|uniref:RusA family crossover junction endodeoxyribonuclease n=1 Tax=Methylibium sp. TaxID=2067992 RepID=UPI003340C67C
MTFSIAIPFPPSTNRIWRNVAGRTLLSRIGREYRARVVEAVYAARVQGFGRQKLRLVIGAHVPDERRRDLDNLLKAANDAMQAARLFEDDSQIVDLRIYRAGLDRQNPRLIVWLEPA